MAVLDPDTTYGQDQPTAKPVLPQGQPRGGARFPVAHPGTFSGIPSLSSQTYLSTFDEAMLHSRENAIRMRLDPVIDACMRLRTYPTALLTNHIDPDDEDDEFEKKCAKDAQNVLANLPGMLFTKKWLLESRFVGRSAAQVKWQWATKRKRQWMLPTRFVMVGGDKLVFKYDGRVGLLVNAMFPGPTESTDRGRAYFLNPEEREQLIVDEFEPEDADFYRPQLAGAIHGSGLRGKLYWLWALKSRIWALGTDFLQWFAQGLTAYYFESGNDAHFQEVRDWVEAQSGQTAILFPRMKDGGPGYKPLERFEAGTASSQFLQALLTDYFDDLIRQSIIGQTLTTQASPTGLGSGASAAHQDTFANIVKYDATGLGETLTRDFLVPFYRANFPGVPCGRWVLEVDNPNVQQLIENAESLYQMGAAIAEQPLLEATGLPAPKEGDTILTNVAPMQPAAVDGMPDGVPVVDGEPQPAGPADPSTSPVRMSRREYSALMAASIKNERARNVLRRSWHRIVVTG